MNKEAKINVEALEYYFLFLFLPLQYAIADIHGEIIRIIDGDTVDVLVNKTPIRVRLVDIDALKASNLSGRNPVNFWLI